MADQIYKVQDPQGNIREISGPAGASDADVIAQAQKLFANIPVKPAYTQIPGGENVTLPNPKPASMQDRIMGAIETPAIIAGGVGRMVATPFAQMIGEAYGGYGTPQGKEAGQRAAQVTSQQFYQPRTETGPDIVNAMSKVLGALPPTLGSTGATLNAVAPAAVGQVRGIVAPIASSTQQRMAQALRANEPQMVGMGAASTNPALIRQERALQQGIPLTKGEQLQDFGLLKRESDLPKENPELAKGLTEFKQTQKESILRRFQQMADETGAEYADPTAYRKVG